MASYHRRSDHLQRLHTHGINYQYQDGAFPATGSIGYIANGTGNVDWSAASIDAAGNMIVPGTLDVSGDATFDSNVVIAGTLDVSGDATFGSDVAIEGTLAVSGDATFDSNVVIAGTLDVSGDATFDSNVVIAGTLDVSGDATFGSDVAIEGTLAVSGDATFDSNVVIAGTLDVSGDATFDSNVVIAGTLDVSGSLTAPYNTTFNSGGVVAMPVGQTTQIIPMPTMMSEGYALCSFASNPGNATRVWSEAGYDYLQVYMDVSNAFVTTISYLPLRYNRLDIYNIFVWGISYGNFAKGVIYGNVYTNPIQVPISSYTTLFYTGNNLFYMNAGSLYGCGRNASGQLGDGSTTDRYTPVLISPQSWTAISTKAINQGHTLGLQANGTLWTWGYNASGQLGQGDLVNRTTPTQVGIGLYKLISAGGQYNFVSGFSAAIDISDSLWMFGSNNQGQLGLNDISDRYIPFQVTTKQWATVAAGGTHTVAIDTSGYMWSWGSNGSGELGQGDLVTRTTPTQIGISNGWTSISSRTHCAALDSVGHLWMWGNNASGQLGFGDIVNRTVPTQLGSDVWTKVLCGYRFTVGLRSDGRLFTWGENDVGQLGLNDQVDRYIPTAVDTRTWWQDIFVGDRTAAAVVDPAGL